MYWYKLKSKIELFMLSRKAFIITNEPAYSSQHTSEEQCHRSLPEGEGAPSHPHTSKRISANSLYPLLATAIHVKLIILSNAEFMTN